MSRYLLHHRHAPDECGVVFASFKGHREPASPPADAGLVPLRRPRDLVDGRRRERRRKRSGLLPFYVAERTTITRVSEVQIP